MGKLHKFFGNSIIFCRASLSTDHPKMLTFLFLLSLAEHSISYPSHCIETVGMIVGKFVFVRRDVSAQILLLHL